MGGQCVPMPLLCIYQCHHPRAFIRCRSKYQKTTLKEGGSEGANAPIVCGHDIGRFAFVDVGFVVTKDVLDYAMVCGTPATMRGYVCQCGEQIKFFNFWVVCSACGKK